MGKTFPAQCGGFKRVHCAGCLAACCLCFLVRVPVDSLCFVFSLSSLCLMMFHQIHLPRRYLGQVLAFHWSMLLYRCGHRLVCWRPAGDGVANGMLFNRDLTTWWRMSPAVTVWWVLHIKWLVASEGVTLKTLCGRRYWGTDLSQSSHIKVNTLPQKHARCHQKTWRFFTHTDFFTGCMDTVCFLLLSVNIDTLSASDILGAGVLLISNALQYRTWVEAW